MRENEQDGVSVHAGFPNPAADKSLSGLDLNRLLIQNSASTFLFRLRGNEWEELGIFDGDIAVVDRALDARKDDLVIWWSEHTDDFAISKYKNVEAGAVMWGVVTSVIHRFRKDSK
ncbi:MAG TPA: S24 family peptidase [Candidatus Saccharimonadales bacterium]|jgi:DNA polymerase V